MKEPLVYVIILNWNGGADTEECLLHLRRSTYRNYRILVVDNGSTDGSVERLERLPLDIELLRNDRNLGYTGGNNLAIACARRRGADYVWLLNNDATVAADALSHLVQAAEASPAAALLSPLIRTAGRDAAIEACCGRIGRPGQYEFTRDVATARLWQRDFPAEIALVGTALLVRCAAIDRIGLLDDALFAYWEDTDYSIRSVKAGFVNELVFDAAVFHKNWRLPNGEPKPLKPHQCYFMMRNEMLMWRKHAPRPFGLKLALWKLRRALLDVERYRAQPPQVEATLSGLWDGWVGRTGAYEPGRRMPRPLRALFTWRPGLWLHLLDGELRAACKTIFPTGAGP